MIKRASVFFILSILCSLTVLGVGFAMWAFDTEGLKTQYMGVKVTQSTVLGDFSVPEIAYVVLDGGTGSGVNPTITGVSFYKGDESNVAVTDNSFTVKFTVRDAHKPQMDEDNNWDKVKFGIRISVPEELNGLITHTEFYNERLGTNGYIDLKALAIELTDHFNDPDNTKSDFKYEAGVFTFMLTTTTLNRFFTYASTKEPTDLNRYENLAGNFAPRFVIELWQGYAETA